MPKDKICTIPWNELAIMQNGDYGICCQCIFHSSGRLITDKKTENILKTDIETVRNHPSYVELRRSMLAGEESPLCKLCWDDEKLGLVSKRMSQKNCYPDLYEKITNSTDRTGRIDAKEFPLNYLDLRLGNLCNLKCRSCGPVDSSLWIEDTYETGQKTFKILNNHYEIELKGNSYKIKSEDFQYYNSDNFEKELSKVIDKIDRIYFTGGEPLINKKHYDILDLCINLGLAKNIVLEYNTNGTTLYKNLLNQWNHFKSVNLCFSIDGMNELAHYIRYPSKWETIEQNLLLIDNSELKNLSCNTNMVINIFNIKHFPEILTWFYEQGFKKFPPFLNWRRMIGPAELTVQVLPLSTKKEITELYVDFIAKSNIPNIESHIWPLIDFMNEKDRSFLLPLAKKKVKQIDRVRNQNIKDYVPWLSDIFDKI